MQAFDNTKEDVAILFSDSSRVYDSVYSNFVLLATEGASCAGKSVKFVTENTIGSLANGCLLIIPNCTAVKASTLSAVNNYAKAGNKVLLLSKCMERDENGKMQNAELLKETYSNCTIYGTNLIWTLVQTFVTVFTKLVSIFKPVNIDMTKGIFDYLSHNRNANTFLLALPFVVLTPMAMRNKILEMSPNNVMLVTGLLNRTVMEVEWRVTEYNGKLLVNVCNYSNRTIKNVSLVYKGKTLGTLDELITQKQVKDNFTLEPFEPMLFSISK